MKRRDRPRRPNRPQGRREIHLTPKEYAFLAELARHPSRVFTHRQLLTAVWGPAFDEHIEYARIVVRNPRQKLEEDPATPKLIVNELGVGYRLKGADGLNPCCRRPQQGGSSGLQKLVQNGSTNSSERGVGRHS